MCQTKTIPLHELKHIDYGYCSTIHSAQGKTGERALGAFLSDNKLLNNQKLWTVFLSRHKNTFKCIVDDSAKLESQIKKNTGDEQSAMEFINQKKQQTEAKKTFSTCR